jgi:hypothetical protein
MSLQIHSFLPSALFVPFLILGFVKHEAAEWSYEGFKGNWALLGLFIDSTAAIGTFGQYLLLIAYGYDHGWLKAISLYIIMLLFGIVDQIIPVLLKRLGPDIFLVFRLVCLASVYGVFIYICFHVSWFGLASK